MKKRKKRKVKRRLKVGNIIIALVVISLLGVGGYTLGSKLLSNDDNPVKEKVSNKIKKWQDKTYEIDLVMVGDNLIHSSVYREANINANGEGYDFKPMVTYIKDIVKDYDLAYYNQETILGGSELGVSSYPQFLSPYETGDAMIDAGFNLVSLATNHTMDRYYSSVGSKAIENSYNYWSSKDDVLFAGSYTSFDQRNEVKIMEKNNITYTMLNYTYGTNGLPVPDGKEYLCNVWSTDSDYEYEAYKEQVKKDIAAVRDKVDVLIVAMHWGVEYTHTPTEYQKDAANFLASQGVDLIIGTHPHVIMPVEYIGDTLVYYSLGNFLSAQEITDYYNKLVGLMGSVKITKHVTEDGSTIKVESTDNQLIFTSHNYNSYNNFKVVPFSHPDISNYLTNYDKVYEHYKNIVTNMDSSIVVKPLGG